MREINSKLTKRSIKDGFQHLLSVISSERFLLKQGIGNDVPFFICQYRPEEAVEMARMQKQLIDTLLLSGIRVLEINLYDHVIDLLKKRGIWDQVLSMEQSVSKGQFQELLEGVLDSETHLIPAIVHKMKKCEFDVMFLSGAGEVFPYIRSHNILNNLQSKAKDKPTVMFFPGEYLQSVELGAALNLFSKFHDGYYRAFDIFDFDV